MTERITPREFQESEGVEDWRVLSEGACAFLVDVRDREKADGRMLVGEARA